MESPPQSWETVTQKKKVRVRKSWETVTRKKVRVRKPDRKIIVEGGCGCTRNSTCNSTRCACYDGEVYCGPICLCLPKKCLNKLTEASTTAGPQGRKIRLNPPSSRPGLQQQQRWSRREHHSASSEVEEISHLFAPHKLPEDCHYQPENLVPNVECLGKRGSKSSGELAELKGELAELKGELQAYRVATDTKLEEMQAAIRADMASFKSMLVEFKQLLISTNLDQRNRTPPPPPDGSFGLSSPARSEGASASMVHSDGRIRLDPASSASGEEELLQFVSSLLQQQRWSRERHSAGSQEEE